MVFTFTGVALAVSRRADMRQHFLAAAESRIPYEDAQLFQTIVPRFGIIFSSKRLEPLSERDIDFVEKIFLCEIMLLLRRSSSFTCSFVYLATLCT